MSARSDRMYGRSPTMKRNEDGDMEIKHIEKAKSAGAEGAMKEGKEALPHHVRHAHERRELKHQHIHEHHALHHRHQVEHSHHDEGELGDKERMHERHERELNEMHGKHHKEVKAMHERHEEELDIHGEHEKEAKSDQKKKGGLLGEEKSVEKE